MSKLPTKEQKRHYQNTARELKSLRKELRRCIKCDKDLDTIKYFSCGACRMKARKYYHKYYQRGKKNGKSL